MVLNGFREKKVWKEDIFVKKYFLQEARNICKRLLQWEKELYSQNNIAKVAHHRLIVVKDKGGGYYFWTPSGF